MYPIFALACSTLLAVVFWLEHGALDETIVHAAPVLAFAALFVAFAAIVGAKIDGLEREAITDPLTGMYNRRHVMQRLQEEIAAARRYRTPLSLLLIDIDRFKAINDELGHDTGDIVLESVGDQLREDRRAGDVAGRIGGDEFVLVLPRTNAAQAQAVAERLRQVIAGAESKSRPLVTVSIGVVELDRAQRVDASQLLAWADAAMYAAKRSGRDRVAIIDAREGGARFAQIARVNSACARFAAVDPAAAR